jgi:hypothetical protein
LARSRYRSPTTYLNRLLRERTRCQSAAKSIVSSAASRKSAIHRLLSFRQISGAGIGSSDVAKPARVNSPGNPLRADVEPVQVARPPDHSTQKRQRVAWILHAASIGQYRASLSLAPRMIDARSAILSNKAVVSERVARRVSWIHAWYLPR